jgi:hypothetical protein
MKAFLAVLGGAVAGQIGYVVATYRLYPQYPGSVVSLADSVWIALVIGLISGAVFFGFYKLFNARTQNVIALSAAAFLAQIAASATVLILPDFGMLSLLITVLVFSAVANYILDRVGSM